MGDTCIFQEDMKHSASTVRKEESMKTLWKKGTSKKKALLADEADDFAVPMHFLFFFSTDQDIRL